MAGSVQQQLQHSLDVLAITPSQSWDDIEKHYRQLIQRLHPDRNPSDASEVAQDRFIEVNTAFKLIREHYRKNGSIPKRTLTEQHEPLLGSRKQTHVNSVFYKKNHFVTAAIGLTTLALFGAILWSLDARIVENNRDRASAEQAQAQAQANIETAISSIPTNKIIKQTSNGAEH